MKKIVCIMGKSASGKSTLIDELIKKNNNMHNVKSFTTRKVRFNDIINDSKTHVFVNIEKLKEDTNNNEIIAIYHNKDKDYYSWTTKKSFSNDEKKINLYTIDPKSFIEFVEKYNSDYEIFGIYLQINEVERIKRKFSRDGISDVIDFEHELSISVLNNNDFIKDFFLSIDITNLKLNELTNIVTEKIGEYFESKA